MAFDKNGNMPLPTLSWGENWDQVAESSFETVIPDMPVEISFQSTALEEYHQFLCCDKSGSLGTFRRVLFKLIPPSGGSDAVNMFVTYLERYKDFLLKHNEEHNKRGSGKEVDKQYLEFKSHSDMTEKTDFRRMKGKCMVNYEDRKDSTTWGTETWNMDLELTFTPKYHEEIKYLIIIKWHKVQGSTNVEKCFFDFKTVNADIDESSREHDTDSKYQLEK